MSVQAVQAEIRLAKADKRITFEEAAAIVESAKRNLQKSEMRQIKALLAEISANQVQADHFVVPTLEKPETPGSYEGVGRIIGDTIYAPVVGLAKLGFKVLHLAPDWLAGPIIVTGILLLLITSFISLLLSPITAIIGGIRAAVIKHED